MSPERRFYYRLAKHLGGMTVEEMLSRMTSHEISEWIAYSTVELIGDDREDYRMANVMALLANINRDPENKPDPFSPVDFMPDFWRREEVEEHKPDWKRNKGIAELITIALGGKDLRHGNTDDAVHEVTG